MLIIQKIKKNYFWFLFLKIFIVPIYDFIWKNIINIHGRILNLLWFKKKKNFFYNLNEENPIFKIENNEELIKLSSKILKACDKNLLTKAENEINTITYNNINESNNGNNKYFTQIFDQLDDETKNEIISFASSDLMISTAANYLKVFPILSKIALTYHIPKNYDQQRGAMMFHKDEFGYKSMDIFIAINDIDNNTGPLKAVTTKYDSLGPFAKIFNTNESTIRGNRGKIKNEIIDQKKISEFSIEGKGGTAILIDSFKCYHSGGHCKLKPRILLRILYSTIDDMSLPKLKIMNKITESYLKNNVNYKNDKFKRFFFTKRSLFFTNKKIGKFLYQFIRIFCYKF